jgi:hypothetical protein
MLTPTPKWSLPAGNAVVPSRWQATKADPLGGLEMGAAAEPDDHDCQKISSDVCGLRTTANDAAGRRLPKR